jgi:GDP-L-fucose synthase
MARRPLVVTGAGGFLGRHVMAALARHEPLGLTRADADLLDPDAARSALLAASPALVVHLAAVVGGIGFNREHPVRLLEDNLRIGLHVVRAAAEAGAAVLLAGTVCSYPAVPPRIPFVESDLWSGYPEQTNAPYGLAKRMLIELCRAYERERGLRWLALLPTNLYGPGDTFDPDRSHVVPALLRKLVEAKEAGAPAVDVWGDGTATRDLLYVEDAAEAFALAAERLLGPDLYGGGPGGGLANLGSGREVSVRRLAHLLASLVGYRGELRFDPRRPGGQPRRVLDSSVAERALGWRPSIDLETGLLRTLVWWLERRAGEEA